MKICIIYDDRDKLEQMSRNAIKVAADNSRDRQLEKFKKAYMKYVFPKMEGA